METLTLDVTFFIEPFNLACCEATNPITHFTLTTRYDESITKWSMKGFTLCLPFFPLHCNHSNRTRINLLLSETTQESPLDLIICFAPFLHFPSAKLRQEWSERQIGEKEKWIACLIPGFSKCNVNGNRNDYHLACNQDAWLIFCSAEMEKDMHIISQDENATVGVQWQVF